MKKMLKLFVVLIALGLFAVSCQKSTSDDLTSPTQSIQLPHNLGCQLLPADEYAKLPVAKDPGVALKATVLNLNTPPVGDQGSQGSCTAWGSTYAGRSTDWQALHPATWSQSVNIFSPAYVYNQIKASSSCASGSYVTTALNMLQSQGSCVWSVMPYTTTCSTKPNSTQTANAANYKIKSYSTVAITSTAIKAQLAAGHPVIVAGNVNTAFENLASGAVLTTYKGSTLGGHCYCVVGYDDTKSAFKFQNSWNTSWATAGFGYISYSYVSTWWTEAYVIND